MAFMDRFKKGYTVKARCFNCGFTMDLKVPKGITIDSYLKTEGAMCENCGNPTLRRIMNSPVQAPPEARRPIMQRRQQPTLPQLPPLNDAQRKRLQQMRARERQHPQYRQQLPPEEFQQEVEYPVDEPIQQDNGPDQNWNNRPKKINFWTGNNE
jgi:hypothetical protein